MTKGVLSNNVGEASGMHHLEDCDGASCKLWEFMLQIVPVTEKSVIIAHIEFLPITVCMLVVVLCTILLLQLLYISKAAGAPLIRLATLDAIRLIMLPVSFDESCSSGHV